MTLSELTMFLTTTLDTLVLSRAGASVQHVEDVVLNDTCGSQVSREAAEGQAGSNQSDSLGIMRYVKDGVQKTASIFRSPPFPKLFELNGERVS